MKLQTTAKQIVHHPAALIGVIVLIAWLVAGTAGAANDGVRKSLLRTGFIAVLITALLRLVLGAAGWPLWLLAGGAFVASGAARDTAAALGIGDGGGGAGGGGGSGTENIYEAASQACATHGGLAGGASILTSPYRRCLCKDGTFQSF